MNIATVRVFLGLFMATWVLVVHGVTFRASLNEAEWRLQASPFECRMWQPIPAYGDAVFWNRAGEDQRFHLAPIRKAMKTGQAQMVSQAPLWDESKPAEAMGKVAVTGRETPVALGKRHAYQLLNELYDGMSPVFTRQAWFAEEETVEVHLSSVNFRKAYRQYQECLASLLPVNFDQIGRSRIYFRTAKWELSASEQSKLAKVVQYVKADPTVTGFYIDGHTDSVGRRLYNLDLSKKRAETVTKYLVANGVDESLITTRYHGERYPLVKNNSSKNRASNRRVTLRLEREGL